MTTTAIVSGDLVVGLSSGDVPGLPVPPELAAANPARLRFDGTDIVDGASITNWHVDENGQKRLSAAPGRQALACAWDDVLVRDGATWRVRTSVDDLKAYAAEKRWSVETGGCAWNGHTVSTDRDSQAKLIAEFVALGAGLRTDGAKWKMADGTYVALTNAEAALMIGAARAHVTAAFATEDAVLAAIEAGTITSIAGIDAAAWPAP